MIDRILKSIYTILSHFFLSSYSSKYYNSISSFYAKFLLLNYSKCLWLSLPRLEQFRFLLLIFFSLFYMTSGLELIHYTKTERFLLGDITIILTDHLNELSRMKSLFIWLTLVVALIVAYDMFNTKRSNAFRIFIIFVNEKDIDPSFIDKYDELTNSSSNFLKYISKILSYNHENFKQFFNRFFCIMQIFHCKSHYSQLS